MQFEIERIVRTALEEDIGLGDVTTEVTVAAETVARAQLVAKEDFTLAGIDVAATVFGTLDPEASFEKLLEDGRKVRRGEVLAWIKGKASILLQGRVEPVAADEWDRLIDCPIR